MTLETVDVGIVVEHGGNRSGVGVEIGRRGDDGEIALADELVDLADLDETPESLDERAGLLGAVVGHADQRHHRQRAAHARGIDDADSRSDDTAPTQASQSTLDRGSRQTDDLADVAQRPIRVPLHLFEEVPVDLVHGPERTRNDVAQL